MSAPGASQLLRDLAVDVLNTAKSSKDTKVKVFQLEQFREIILHRDTSLIEEFIGDVFDFATEKSSIFRKFLLRFSTELFDINVNLTLPHLIDMYSFYLSEANDSVVATMCREISKLYAKLALAIYHFPDQQESRRLWPLFRTICNKLADYVASARSEPIKIFGLQLMEAMMFFGISTVSTSADPRLQRKINDPRLRRAAGANASSVVDASAISNPSAGGLGGTGANTGAGAGVASGANNTADVIAAHHPFIAKNLLQSEADELFTKLCLWATKNGPPTFSFSPRLMSLLGQTLAAVGIFRPHVGVQAAKAVLAIFLSETITVQMSTLEKEQLARAATRLQRAITVYGNNADPDTDETIAKLKSEVNRLALNESATSEVTGNEANTGKKRDYTEFIDEEDNELASEEHKASVKTALLTLETHKRQLVERSQAQLDNNMFNANAAGTTTSGYSVDTRSLPSVPTAEITELSAELVSLQNLSFTSATKLVSIDNTTHPENAQKASYITPLMNFDGREYADLAQFNLLRVMDNFLLVKDMKPTKTWRVCQELLLRAVLSLSMSSVQAGTTPFLVTLVHSFSNLINSSSSMANVSNVNSSSSLLVHSQQVPSSVLLPRAIWLFVSFAFQVAQPIFPRGHVTSDVTTADQEEKSKQITLTLLTQFCQRFYSCIMSLEEDNSNGASNEISSNLIHHYRTIYGNMILVILSRFLQIASFRGYVKDWMFQLPHIPLAAMHMVILVSQTGSKNPTMVHGNMGHNIGAHSQRHDALSLLGGFVFAQDELLSQKTLQYLLWQTLSDDFKLRHKIIDLIINEIYGQNPEVDAIITGFALQSLAFLLNPIYLRDTFSMSFKVYMDNQREIVPVEDEEMNVDEMNEEEYEAYLARKRDDSRKQMNNRTRSLYEVIDSFDIEDVNATVDAKLFAQYFYSLSDDDQNVVHADPTKQQENFTKAFHLLERLSVVDVNMLVIFEEVFLLASHNPQLSSIVSLSSDNLDNTSSKTLAAAGETDVNVDASTTEVDATTANPSNNESWNIGVLVRAKLKVVLADLLSRSSSSNSNSNVNHSHNKKYSAAELFHILAQIRGRFTVATAEEWQRDELAPLVYALQCLLPQLDQPPKIDLIIQVLSYLQLPYSKREIDNSVHKALLGQEKSIGNLMDVDEETNEKENESMENAVPIENCADKDMNGKPVSEETLLPTISELEENFFHSWLPQMDDDRFVVFTQLLPAFSAASIFTCLPRIIRVYTSSEFLLTRSLFAIPSSSTAAAGGMSVANVSSEASFSALKTLIQRFIKPIPPPISRAQLLLHLLRIDNEAENIDRKAYLAVIDLCLANKGDFHAKVIKDCMEMIVFPPELSDDNRPRETTDEVAQPDEETVKQRASLLIPPFAIMRMAILSAKNYPELIGSYVLHTMIPTFIARQVWVTAPKVWEGVVMASKILAVSGSIHAEATLKALLGMPVSQLIGVIKVAPNLLPAMKKILSSVGEEKEKLLKAYQQYSPLQTIISTATSNNNTNHNEGNAAAASKAEKDKEKLFKDILEGKIGGAAAKK